MTGRLLACEGCSRHVRANDDRCPFCERPRSRVAETVKRAAAVVASLAVGATLAACYGRPVNRDNFDRQPIDDASRASSASPSPSPPSPSAPQR